MTVGIAAYGPAAGRAVLAGLAAVEAVGAGDIGGFGVFTAIGADGGPIMAETQRGGRSMLLADLDRQGVTLDAEEAAVAALISSGPDRPEPLAQFLPGSAAGLVTGHRLPNTLGAEGMALNVQALRLMEAGAEPDCAVAAVVEANPEIDAGLIAVAPGRLALAETRRVLRRNDRGAARLELRDGAAAVAVLHNSIQPFEGLAALVAGAARLVLEAALEPLPSFRVPAAIMIELGAVDGVWLGPDGSALRIASANPGLARYRGWTSSAVYLGTPVYRGVEQVGTTVGEARCRLDRGRIEEVDPARSEVRWAPLPGR